MFLWSCCSFLAVSTTEPAEDHRETFVIMMSDRVSDIWRGYWAQRLLWEIGGHVAFGPPSLNQVRCRVLLRHEMSMDKSYCSKDIPLVDIKCFIDENNLVQSIWHLYIMPQ